MHLEKIKVISFLMGILLVSVPALTAVTTAFAQESDEEESESESTDEPEPEPEPEPQEPDCPEDQVVEDGECVEPEPEPEPTCPEGQVLEDGECVEPQEPPTQCDPPEVPCDDGGGTKPTEPPEVPAPAPTPVPQPTPTPIPTNPDGVVQQPAAPSKPCEVWNIAEQNQTESTSTAAPTGSCPKIEVILSTNTITPEIGQVRFGSIIPVPGAPQTHTQPYIDGGTVDITVRVSGLPDNSNIL